MRCQYSSERMSGCSAASGELDKSAPEVFGKDAQSFRTRQAWWGTAGPLGPQSANECATACLMMNGYDISSLRVFARTIIGLPFPCK